MQERRFAIIGLGHFGGYVLRTLYQTGVDIIAIDADPELVRGSAEFAKEAITADATDRHALESIGLSDVDVAIVSLGQRMDLITLAALHVKEIGVPHIAVKALSEEHGRILAALGIHEIIHPEKDAATRLAQRLARPDLLNYLPLLPGYSIAETRTPVEFAGKSLRQLALRNTLRVQLIAIRRAGKDLNIMPAADDVLEKDDIMIMLGADADLDHIRDIVREPRGRRVLPA